MNLKTSSQNKLNSVSGTDPSSFQALLDTLELIGHRRDLGGLLAEGTKLAAQQLGGGSGDWAMHVKGLEMPGYEPRSLKTMALGLAVTPRGACHNRSSAYEADFSGRVDRLTVDDSRGLIAAESEDFTAVLDSLIWCKFLRKAFNDFYQESAQVYTMITGWEISPGQLKQAGDISQPENHGPGVGGHAKRGLPQSVISVRGGLFRPRRPVDRGR